MDILYLDCFSGISGNMMIGGLLDLGIDEKILLEGLEKLNLDGYKIKIEKQEKNGIRGTHVDVVVDDHDHHNHHDHHHRNLKDIRSIIENSSLDMGIKDLSKKIFEKIAIAEARVHGKGLEEVHFHEVGAVDSIVDIVGVSILLNELKVDKIIASKIHLGSGFLKCDHGIMPVPAPATLEILKDSRVPFYSRGIKKELTTPTGAAIVATIVNEFSDLPEMTCSSIGYGLGTRDLEIPNLVRIIKGEKKKMNTFI